MPFEGYKRRDENSGYLQAGVVPKVTENGDGTLTQHVNIDSMPTGTVVVTSLPTGSVSVNNFPSFYSVSGSVVVSSIPTGSVSVLNFPTYTTVSWSRWFELHSFEYDQPSGQYFRRGKIDFRGQRVDQYLASLNALNIPVYMQRPWPIIPHAVGFPVQQIVQTFGNYFTNTISWQIALAILEGFKTIGIWGVDMAESSPLRHQNEYSHQRPSCEYFIGLARGRAIEVIIPPSSDLLKTNFLYCYQEPEENAFIVKMEAAGRGFEPLQTPPKGAVPVRRPGNKH